jgi:hypothetical protein
MKGLLSKDIRWFRTLRPRTSSWHYQSDHDDAAGTIKAAVDAILEGFPPS